LPGNEGGADGMVAIPFGGPGLAANEQLLPGKVS